MGRPNMYEVARTDLFTSKDEINKKYTSVVAEHILRLRDMYIYKNANPSIQDRQFVDEEIRRFKISTVAAYNDLAIIKSILPHVAESSRDYHRWRYNEMILETYKMAKARKDTKTMERAASSYAKFNKIDAEDVTSIPYDLIVVQPFTATSDPTVLGIKPIPNIQKKIQEMLQKYRAESIDIDDVEFEEADVKPLTND